MFGWGFLLLVVLTACLVGCGWFYFILFLLFFFFLLVCFSVLTVTHLISEGLASLCGVVIFMVSAKHFIPSEKLTWICLNAQ